MSTPRSSLRFGTWALALSVALVGCNLSGPGDVEGIAYLVLDTETPLFTQVGESTVRWGLVFRTGTCCLTESQVSRTIRGDTVTVLPRFRYQPCADRCMAHVSDTATAEFPGAAAVRFRILGEGHDGHLAVAFDTTFTFDPTQRTTIRTLADGMVAVGEAEVLSLAAKAVRC